ncbi:phage replisome organizer N-terminal domain-containing protein [Weissella paramesenteroides]|uniref:phage replisome organizer N-terminal domain-containing protein n=1 Tax=Weissella paramesenteroides TaxID=1249 RepID=UPI0023AA0BD2|nr:phage replisome organizer N-terminal domain-containing protein [Weissella paramesenteroides]WEA52265.1 phage replisome organizer N-terminal domain-containing protein [Weissella paramesenteroides]
MADNKKYYYIRLKENFFDSDEIKLLESIPNDGYKFSNILLKMYLKSLKYNGRLMFNERIPFNAEMLATVTGHSIGDIERAIEMFKKFGLIEVLETGEIYMLDIQSFIGKTSTEADRIKAYRRNIESKKQKGVQMYDKRTPEIEIDKETELELDSDLELKTETDLELEPKNSQSSVVTNFKQSLLKALHDNGIFISPQSLAFDDLVAFHEDDGMDIDLIIKAIELASESGKTNINYIKGILNNKLSKNILTLNQYEKDEQSWQNKRNGGNAEQQLTPEQAKWLSDRQRKREQHATS